MGSAGQRVGYPRPEGGQVSFEDDQSPQLGISSKGPSRRVTWNRISLPGTTTVPFDKEVNDATTETQFILEAVSIIVWRSNIAISASDLGCMGPLRALLGAITYRRCAGNNLILAMAR